MSTGLVKKFFSASDDSYTQLFSPIDDNDTTIRCNNLQPWTIGDKVILVLDRIDNAGNYQPAGKKEIIYAEISADNYLINCIRGIDGTTAQAHGTGVMVEDLITSTHFEALREGLLVTMNEDGTLKSDIIAQAQMENNSVGTAELLDSNVTTAKLASGAVTTAKFKPTVIDWVPSTSGTFGTTSTSSVDVTNASFTYTSGATPEKVHIECSAMFLMTGTSSAVHTRVLVNGVAFPDELGYNNILNIWQRQTKSYWFDIPANTSYIIKFQMNTENASTSGTFHMDSIYRPAIRGFSIYNGA